MDTENEPNVWNMQLRKRPAPALSLGSSSPPDQVAPARSLGSSSPPDQVAPVQEDPDVVYVEQRKRLARSLDSAFKPRRAEGQPDTVTRRSRPGTDPGDESSDQDSDGDGNHQNSGAEDWRERFRRILETGAESDLTIHVGRTAEEISIMSAHTRVLSLGSSVLAKKIQASSVCPTSGKLLLKFKDSPEVLSLLVRFLYYEFTEDKLVTIQRTLGLLHLALKLKVSKLPAHCGRLILNSNVANDYALHILEFAGIMGDVELEDLAIDHVCRNAGKLVESNHFLEVALNVVEKILEKDSLVAINEMQLFEAVMRWGHTQLTRRNQTTVDVITDLQLLVQELRKILLTVLPLIRFPQLTCVEFWKVIGTHLFGPDELLYVMKPGGFSANSSPRQYTGK